MELKTLSATFRRNFIIQLRAYPKHFFGGNMLQQIVTTSGEIFVMIILSISFGLRFPGFNGAAFIVCFILSLFSFFVVSMPLACIMLYTRDTYISQNTLFALIFLLCGITFPYQYLPDSIQLMSRLIPVTYAAELIRGSTLLGLSLSEQMTSIIQLIILSSVYCFTVFYFASKCLKSLIYLEF